MQRRNSRYDMVQRLLEAAHEEGSAVSPRASMESVFSSCNSSATSPRRGFQKLRAGPAQEQVGPQSFECLSLVGRGAFAEVYHVRQRSTGESFAMKVQHKEKVFRSNLLRYAMTERHLLSYIRHPYIVSLHYAFQTSNHLVMVLTYCSGGTLQQLLRSLGRHLSALDERGARHFTAELLLALVYLHERKIVYRDLKPDNVLLDGEGHAMLTDFGLSKDGVRRGVGTKTHCGSVAYIAPEILLGKMHGPTVDIYNLGVLLYTMLIGLPPFFHREKERLRQNIASQPLELPSCLPGEAASLIAATMEREPDLRIGARDTAEVKKHEFFNKIDFDALAARQVPAPPLPDLPPIPPEGQGEAEPSKPQMQRRRSGRRQSQGKNVYIEGWDYKDPSASTEAHITSYLQRSPGTGRKPRPLRFRGLRCLRWLLR